MRHGTDCHSVTEYQFGPTGTIHITILIPYKATNYKLSMPVHSRIYSEAIY